MKLGHLHLNTRDRTASENFYGRWFDMQVQRRGKLLTFLVDEYGFELALMDDATPAAMPPWFHFGFRLNSADAVIDLNRRMIESAVEFGKPLYQDPELVSFRCLDPDGYQIEIYWESVASKLDA